jgi:DNA-binding CsgD family transcriptional regulator
MTVSRSRQDLHARVLDLVGEISALLGLSELHDGMLSALRSAVPCDYVSLNQVGPDPARNWSIVEPPLSPEAHEVFYRLAHQNPLAAWHLRTRDGRPIRLSDLVAPAEFHATDLYREFYAPIAIEYQISFVLPSTEEHILAIALSRRETDFTDEERELLTLARPHLIQIYRNAVAHTNLVNRAALQTSRSPDQQALEGLGLTPAQARVLRLVAIGHSTADISRELAISERTVQKHLQRVFQHLGVSNRAAAAHRAWQATLP